MRADRSGGQGRSSKERERGKERKGEEEGEGWGNGRGNAAFKTHLSRGGR